MGMPSNMPGMPLGMNGMAGMSGMNPCMGMQGMCLGAFVRIVVADLERPSMGMNPMMMMNPMMGMMRGPHQSSDTAGFCNELE